jgi:uncharacterized protein HemX
MKRITPFLWSITIVLALGLGIYAGHHVTAAYKDAELAAMRAQVEQANEETVFWRATLKMIVDGDQVEGINLTGRPSKGD